MTNYISNTREPKTKVNAERAAELLRQLTCNLKNEIAETYPEVKPPVCVPPDGDPDGLEDWFDHHPEV